MKTGIKLIADERERQILKEGWTEDHDDQHTDGSLAMAASLYAAPHENLLRVDFCETCDSPHVSDPWPWLDNVGSPRGGSRRYIHAWDKREKHSRIRRLEIAGALIAAEIDRLQRVNIKKPPSSD